MEHLWDIMHGWGYHPGFAAGTVTGLAVGAADLHRLHTQCLFIHHTLIHIHMILETKAIISSNQPLPVVYVTESGSIFLE